MKKLLLIMRLPPNARPRDCFAHHLWLAISLTALGCYIGILSLLFSATAYMKLDGWAMFDSYLTHPTILALNLLPAVVIIWLVYFVSRRAWVAFLGSFLCVVGVAMVNYFKIRLRSDPLVAADLRLAAEAGGIVGNYTLDLSPLIWLALGSLVLGLVFSLVLMPNGLRGWQNRLFGALSCGALLGVCFFSLYLNPQLYQATTNNQLINQWSPVEVYVSKGSLYPFLHSAQDMFPKPPAGYEPDRAKSLLAQYVGQDIPADSKVSVMGIMLEAFSDVTDYPILANQRAVTQLYRPWHQLEGESVSGDLLTNIFAGGTVDSEWGFLTGYTSHEEFRKSTDSYVWYFKEQGYQSFGSHPGYSWFYNRQNVNQYLGFDEYWFTENHYGALVDPLSAIWNSDHILMAELFTQLQQRVEDGPCFSFSVSYQNHGPYDGGYTAGTEYLPASLHMSEESRNIWNNYLKGIEDTIHAATLLVDNLRQLEEPVVLVLFGDHKPWGGNGNSAYAALGVEFDLSTPAGFYDYYSTPYLIWANPAAKAVLDRPFTGEGGDFSPSFLMEEVFNQCGWVGPGFMQLSRQMRQVSPLVHQQGLFFSDWQLSDTLSPEAKAFYQDFLSAQYYRETKVLPTT